MHIGIDLRPLAPGVTGGINLVLRGVLETLVSDHPEHTFTVFTTPFNRSLLKRRPDAVRLLTLPPEGFYARLGETARTEGIDVLFRAYPLEDDLDFPMERQIVFIPDLQHEDLPEFFPPPVLRARRRAFHRVLARAGAIGTLTEWTRQRLQSHPWTYCSDIFLMGAASPLALEPPEASALTPEEEAQLPRREFFLYPANLWPHKNHRRVLQAFDLFRRRTGLDMEFVLTGDPDGWSELRRDLGEVPVRHLGFVRPAFLYALLRRARALVFFSLYEGFGIPLLEAFEVGTPVLCSPLPSLREVGGDAVLTADPTDVEAMSVAMERIVRDAALRAELIERGRARVRGFSWHRSAENLLEACHRVATRAGLPGPRCTVEDPPLVSVVTPSYNQAPFLRRTIESVLGQTYPHIEYIVIDGGSRDGSVDILKSYGNRIRWVSEPDRGQAHAINKGFARARGSIRAYLNSDDVLLPDAVERAVGYFQAHPDWDLLYGRAYYIDEADRVIGMYPTDEYSFERLMRDCCICQPAAFWRTRIAEVVGPFNEDLHYALDYEYWLRIDRVGGRIVHVPDVLAASRLHPMTKTLAGRRSFYREIFRVCRQWGGYVDISYFWGLWHHLLRERAPRGIAWLGRIPGVYPLIVRTHHWLYHHGARPGSALGQALRHWIRRWATARFPGAYHRLHRWVAAFLPRTGPHRRVYGFWPDGWLAPTVQVFLPHPSPGQEYYIAGRAPVSMDLVVRVSGGPRRRYHLPADEVFRMGVPIRPPGPRRVYLRFSRYVVDPRLRPIAFYLLDTNLFSERDL
jgi:glycosyltransferase involved in cell wall biosynthesis